jgi:acetate kinase
MILVINSGSSSIKFQLYEPRELEVIAEGLVERIGEGHAGLHYHHQVGSGFAEVREDEVDIPDHETGLKEIVRRLGEHTGAEGEKLTAIGHRVVHGGDRYSAPVLIDDQVIATIRELIPLAPLHNPANLCGIEVARQCFGHLPQVAVFDTAFHHTIPEHAYRYALPEECYEQHHVRRYGFHGISHYYVVKQAAALLDQPLERLNLITLHLGNGASVAAIEQGRCVDTSMGMTPLEGLMMGSRCGDLDPAVPLYLARAMDKDDEEIDHLLNEHSGLVGVCGVNDMREIHRRVREGDAAAQRALEMYCYRIRKYIGAYFAVLGRVDALVFTAGIGEHDAEVRRRSCAGLETLGISIDDERNETGNGRAVEIQRHNSGVKILVIPTDEEREIAMQTLRVVNDNA